MPNIDRIRRYKCSTNVQNDTSAFHYWFQPNINWQCNSHELRWSVTNECGENVHPLHLPLVFSKWMCSILRVARFDQAKLHSIWARAFICMRAIHSQRGIEILFDTNWPSRSEVKLRKKNIGIVSHFSFFSYGRWLKLFSIRNKFIFHWFK